jgi:hypothetical protein
VTPYNCILARHSIVFFETRGANTLLGTVTRLFNQASVHLYTDKPAGEFLWTIGRVKDEKSQLGITAICFFGTILYGETEFTSLLMF